MVVYSFFKKFWLNFLNKMRVKGLNNYLRGINCLNFYCNYFVGSEVYVKKNRVGLEYIMLFDYFYGDSNLYFYGCL